MLLPARAQGAGSARPRAGRLCSSSRLRPSAFPFRRQRCYVCLCDRCAPCLLRPAAAVHAGLVRRCAGAAGVRARQQ
eukprot:681610-Alexandrium_andersonii.AAC.1